MPGPKPLVANEGQQTLVESVTGPTSYTTGGFPAQANLGRVDEATVEAVSDAYDAYVSSVGSNNTAYVQVVATDTATEQTGGTDLSGTTFTLTSHRL